MKKAVAISMIAAFSIMMATPAWAQITGISGASGSQKYYYYDAPAGLSKLEIKIAGGTGDCDLYVKYGSQPTTSSYNYRPYLSGNNETVAVNNPSSGRWYIMLRGYSAYSGVTLSVATWAGSSRVATPTVNPGSGSYLYSQNVTISCSTAGATIRYTINGSEPTSSSTQYTGPISVDSSRTIKAKAFKSGMAESYTASATYTISAPSATTLINGQTVSSLSGSAGNEKFYKISVPSGQTKLEIKTWGGSGDCDLYVKLGSNPSTSSYSSKSMGGNNSETITVNNPAAGTWYILLSAYSAYSGLSLSANYGANTLIWPLPSRAPISQSFGVLWSANSSKKHTGIDIAAPKLTAVKAAKSGTVSRVGWLGSDAKTGEDWGNYVIVSHDNDSWTTCYLHISSKLRVGAEVAAGSTIGTVFKDHLHFGIRIAPASSISPKGALPIINGTTSDPTFPEKFAHPTNYIFTSM